MQALLSPERSACPGPSLSLTRRPRSASARIAVPLVRFDGKAVAALNIGVQPEQVSANALITDCLPLLLEEATALKERLV